MVQIQNLIKYLLTYELKSPAAGHWYCPSCQAFSVEWDKEPDPHVPYLLNIALTSGFSFLDWSVTSNDGFWLKLKIDAMMFLGNVMR